MLAPPARAADAGDQERASNPGSILAWDNSGLPVHQVPDTIPADLETDATEALQQFIDQVPDGAVIRFPENAGYRIEGTLTLADRQGIVIDGNGATFRSLDRIDDGPRLQVRNRAHWRVGRDSRLIALRNLTVRGPHDEAGTDADAWDAAREAQHAFDIDGARDVLIEDVRASHVLGDGVYIRSQGVVVRRSRFHHLGRQGVAIANARDVLVEQCDFRDIRRGVFNIEQYAAGWSSANVRILNNTSGRSRLLWMPVSGAGVAGGVLVAGNVMEAGTGIPVITNQATDAGRRGPFVVVGNRFVVSGSPQPAFRLSGIDGVLFAGNHATLPEARAMTALRALDCTAVVAFANRFEGAAEAVVIDNDHGFSGADGEESEFEHRELEGGHALRVTSGSGQLIALVRLEPRDSGDDPDRPATASEPVLSAWELETEADYAVIVLDPAGNRILHTAASSVGETRFRNQPVRP